MMDAPLREFRESMCAEHLDDAAALLDIADGLRADPLGDWRASGPFEQRVFLHIDALVLGGEPADLICQAALAAGDDAAACHAAAAVFALRGDAAQVRALTDRLAGGGFDPACAYAIGRALTVHLPLALERELLGTLLETSQDSLAAGQAVLWRVLGERRSDTRGLLAKTLQEVNDHGAPVSGSVELWIAAMHCTDEIEMHAARFACRSDNPEVATQALACCLGRRDAPTLQWLEAICRGSDDGHHLAEISPMLLATAGSASASRALLHALEHAPRVEIVEALGVCGSLAAVRPLIGCLADAALAEPAAQALHLITGLDLRESVRVENPVEEGELFPRELERFRSDGAVPKAADGLAYASHLKRLSRDPARWTSALHEAAARFNAGLRYRFGQPYTLAALLGGLHRPFIPNALRLAFVNEAVFRHGVDLRISDWTPVSVQLARLDSTQVATAIAAATSAAGRWCRDGSIIA